MLGHPKSFIPPPLYMLSEIERISKSVCDSFSFLNGGEIEDGVRDILNRFHHASLMEKMSLFNSQRVNQNEDMELRKQKYFQELELYQKASLNKNWEEVVYYLGRAHILSQIYPLSHLYVHFLMLFSSLRFFRLGEISGQILRVFVTLPGHLIGKVPKGNIGWSTVPLTQEMDIPEDLKSLC